MEKSSSVRESSIFLPLPGSRMEHENALNSFCRRSRLPEQRRFANCCVQEPSCYFCSTLDSRAFPLDGPQSPDCVSDGLLLHVSICALHQCLRPLKHGCFCGIHVLPQLLRVSFKKCGFKFALPVWVSYFLVR